MHPLITYKLNHVCNASSASSSGSSRPPHFSGVRTINNRNYVLSHFPIFGNGKTVPIHCHVPASFFGPPGFDRARAHLYSGSCSSSLKCSALKCSALIALRRDKTMIRRYYACYVQCSDTSLIHKYFTMFSDWCQSWRFSTCRILESKGHHINISISVL